ncbi:MAG: circularly permuted type 2 ATP-grasp protein, partial [Chloroflexota bacterium]|nr:circularly permuted type 2 ATP-grasp protein [Chloroflexota bacterium]
MMAQLPQNSETTVSEYRSDAGDVRAVYSDVLAALDGLGDDSMRERWRQANREVKLDAFSFALDPKEFRPVPTDWIPRIIEMDEWRNIKAGVEQRLRALNAFLLDVYAGAQTVVPDDVVYSCQYFYPELQGFRPAKDVFVHIYGIDLVQQRDGKYVVLEDNLRIPSGITYQLKTMEIARQIFPE